MTGQAMGACTAMGADFLRFSRIGAWLLQRIGIPAQQKRSKNADQYHVNWHVAIPPDTQILVIWHKLPAEPIFDVEAVME